MTISRWSVEAARHALAPTRTASRSSVDEEASRTLKRYLAARRVVDVPKAKGPALAAASTGHTQPIEGLSESVQATRRAANALVQLRVPFKPSRQAIDDAERDAVDSGWSAVKGAAHKIAFAEDRAVFDGWAAPGSAAAQPATKPWYFLRPPMGYPGAVAQAVNQLRLAGCNGPYTLMLGVAFATTRVRDEIADIFDTAIFDTAIEEKRAQGTGIRGMNIL